MRTKTTNTYKEFRKIERKYWRRHYPWVDREGKWHKAKYESEGLLNIWVRFVVDTLDKAREVLRYHKSGNTKAIMETFIRHYHQPCQLWNMKTKEYDVVTLVGIEITNEDLYYIYENKEGHIIYDTCVSKFIPC